MSSFLSHDSQNVSDPMSYLHTQPKSTVAAENPARLNKEVEQLLQQDVFYDPQAPMEDDDAQDQERMDSDVDRFIQAWRNERTSPSLLPFQFELVENLLELVEAQVC